MAELKWDEVGEREYETGVSHGVLFVFDPNGGSEQKGDFGSGVAWNGLTAVNEAPSGAETTSLYADDDKYLNLLSKEEFGCTIEAYMSPKEFDACDGMKEIAPGIKVGQQDRRTFAFAYQTLIGNDTEGTEHGKKLHIVYGCTASPSGKDYSTVNDSPEAMTLSWEIKTTPVDIGDGSGKKTATVTIASTEVSEALWKKITEYVFGSASGDSKLPMPKDLIELAKADTASQTSEVGE